MPGPYNSKESLEEYARLKALLKANNGILAEQSPSCSPADLTVAELVERFLREHVEIRYCYPDGTATSERGLFISTLRPLVRLFGTRS